MVVRPEQMGRATAVREECTMWVMPMSTFVEQDKLQPACGEISRISVEQIQQKSRVRERTPENSPRIRAGVEKKDQKA